MLALAMSLALVSGAHAEPTRVTVRVLSKGAKFIGTSMGGVLVTLHEADTGQLLARGVTAGSTGDTQRIMTEPHDRRGVRATEGSAAFSTTLELDEPILLRVEAFGPLAQRQAANRVSWTQWVVPGKHLDGGDAVLLEMPGFVVDVLAPPAHSRWKVGDDVPLRANVVMMCGCPVEPGGLWDADGYEVQGIVRRDGETLETIPVPYAGATSSFGTDYHPPGPGEYEVILYCYDPANGNTGLDRVTFLVR
jgi:hypothetical protein